VVSAADVAGEMGSISAYLNANAITGRAGLYPSRYQSDQTDLADGPIVRHGNRRLRAALMRMADNLAKCNAFFHGKALLLAKTGIDPRAVRVRIAKTVTRLIFALVGGR